MTQPQLVTEYCREHGSITPAKLVTRSYKGGWFGSELPRVCRRMREKGILKSEPDERGFEKFYLVEGAYSDRGSGLPVEQPRVNLSVGATPTAPTICCYSFRVFKTHSSDCKLKDQPEVKIESKQQALL